MAVTGHYILASDWSLVHHLDQGEAVLLSESEDELLVLELVTFLGVGADQRQTQAFLVLICLFHDEVTWSNSD